MKKTVLVTGGTGAVGREIVKKLTAADWETFFTWRSSPEKALALAEETGAFAIEANLTDNQQVIAMIKMIEEKSGPLDGLVNNAGMTQVMPFAMIEEEDWDNVMAANLKTMFLVTHAAVRGMIRKKAGVIVNIGSLAGHRMLEVPIHYAAAKAGVTGFTLSLAREMARYNIRVNEVVPGLLSDGVGKMVPEPELNEYLKYCTAGRPGEPSEVADLVEFLLSNRATYINAQSIGINGGI